MCSQFKKWKSFLACLVLFSPVLTACLPDDTSVFEQQKKAFVHFVTSQMSNRFSDELSREIKAAVVQDVVETANETMVRSVSCSVATTQTNIDGTLNAQPRSDRLIVTYVSKGALTDQQSHMLSEGGARDVTKFLQANYGQDRVGFVSSESEVRLPKVVGDVSFWLKDQKCAEKLKAVINASAVEAVTPLVAMRFAAIVDKNEDGPVFENGDGEKISIFNCSDYKAEYLNNYNQYAQELEKTDPSDSSLPLYQLAPETELLSHRIYGSIIKEGCSKETDPICFPTNKEIIKACNHVTLEKKPSFDVGEISLPDNVMSFFEERFGAGIVPNETVKCIIDPATGECDQELQYLVESLNDKVSENSVYKLECTTTGNFERKQDGSYKYYRNIQIDQGTKKFEEDMDAPASCLDAPGWEGTVYYAARTRECVVYKRDAETNEIIETDSDTKQTIYEFHPIAMLCGKVMTDECGNENVSYNFSAPMALDWQTGLPLLTQTGEGEDISEYYEKWSSLNPQMVNIVDGIVEMPNPVTNERMIFDMSDYQNWTSEQKDDFLRYVTYYNGTSIATSYEACETTGPTCNPDVTEADEVLNLKTSSRNVGNHKLGTTRVGAYDPSTGEIVSLWAGNTYGSGVDSLISVRAEDLVERREAYVPDGSTLEDKMHFRTSVGIAMDDGDAYILAHSPNDTSKVLKKLTSYIYKNGSLSENMFGFTILLGDDCSDANDIAVDDDTIFVLCNSRGTAATPFYGVKKYTKSTGVLSSSSEFSYTSTYNGAELPPKKIAVSSGDALYVTFGSEPVVRVITKSRARVHETLDLSPYYQTDDRGTSSLTDDVRPYIHDITVDQDSKKLYIAGYGAADNGLVHKILIYDISDAELQPVFDREVTITGDVLPPASYSIEVIGSNIYFIGGAEVIRYVLCEPVDNTCRSDNDCAFGNSCVDYVAGIPGVCNGGAYCVNSEMSCTSDADCRNIETCNFEESEPVYGCTGNFGTRNYAGEGCEKCPFGRRTTALSTYCVNPTGSDTICATKTSDYRWSFNVIDECSDQGTSGSCGVYSGCAWAEVDGQCSGGTGTYTYAGGGCLDCPFGSSEGRAGIFYCLDQNGADGPVCATNRGTAPGPRAWSFDVSMTCANKKDSSSCSRVTGCSWQDGGAQTGQCECNLTGQCSSLSPSQCMSIYSDHCSYSAGTPETLGNCEATESVSYTCTENGWQAGGSCNSSSNNFCSDALLTGYYSQSSASDTACCRNEPVANCEVNPADIVLRTYTCTVDYGWVLDERSSCNRIDQGCDDSGGQPLHDGDRSCCGSTPKAICEDEQRQETPICWTGISDGCQSATVDWMKSGQGCTVDSECGHDRAEAVYCGGSERVYYYYRCSVDRPNK